ncbi:unnamed protein product [Trichobilharzia regenti]|nr:unnamed protein product [Trichobilharzia regenti]
MMLKVLVMILFQLSVILVELMNGVKLMILIHLKWQEDLYAKKVYRVVCT